MRPAMTDLPLVSRPQWRVGALVPPANPTVEVEYPALLPPAAALHAMRLPVVAGDLDTRNLAYLDSYASCLQGFGSLKLDGAVIALTGSQYRIGHQEDLRRCEQLSERFGMPVETASSALARALRHLGITRISMVSPYPDWLTELAIAYWSGAGVHVDHVEHFADELVAYKVSPAEVAQRLASVQAHPDGAVLLSGTGMPTIESIMQATGRQVPILSSNLCSIWSISRTLGIPHPDWMTRAFPWLCAT